jgi:hypothetical protein
MRRCTVESKTAKALPNLEIEELVCQKIGSTSPWTVTEG